jgi:thymidylate synthase (FAD)
MQSYRTYEGLLADGIAREVARMCLPVAIFSSAYVTCNARSLMSFLSLRTKSEAAQFPSFPQREIEMVAELMELQWSELMPETNNAFCKHGRVSP